MALYYNLESIRKIDQYCIQIVFSKMQSTINLMEGREIVLFYITVVLTSKSFALTQCVSKQFYLCSYISFMLLI